MWNSNPKRGLVCLIRQTSKMPLNWSWVAEICYEICTYVPFVKREKKKPRINDDFDGRSKDNLPRPAQIGQSLQLPQRRWQWLSWVILILIISHIFLYIAAILFWNIFVKKIVEQEYVLLVTHLACFVSFSRMTLVDWKDNCWYFDATFFLYESLLLGNTIFKTISSL